MIKRSQFIVILIPTLTLLLALLTGCGQQVSTSQDEGYFPHGDGYSWTYTVISTTEISGQDPYTTTTEETYYFDGTTVITDEIVAQNYCKEGNPTETHYFLINDSVVYSFGTVIMPTTEAKVFLPYPLSIGEIWQSILNSTAEVLAYESVSVPLGTFDAYKIKRTYATGFKPFEWYAQNVGKVKYYSKFDTSIWDEGEGRLIPATYEATKVLKSKNF